MTTIVIHRGLKKRTTYGYASYNFDTHEQILIFFGRNVTDKVGNQKMLKYATSNNLCFCATWQSGGNTKITLFTQMLH